MKPRRRIARRAVMVIVILAGLGIAGSAVLFLVTPSPGNAGALVQAQDRAHGVAYPGPPVPARFARALVATEDHRFYQDPGIDPVAIGRVVLGRLSGGGDEGGATIDQQLAKMLYTPGRGGLSAEAEQLALAVKLDLTYSKARILQMYAEVAYFGHGFYGLAAASCGYFGAPPARLSWPQAALLAGLVQAPSADDPLVHPAQARAREAHVLGRLVAMRDLTRAQAGEASSQPLLSLAAHGSTGCAT